MIFITGAVMKQAIPQGSIVHCEPPQIAQPPKTKINIPILSMISLPIEILEMMNPNIKKRTVTNNPTTPQIIPAFQILLLFFFDNKITRRAKKNKIPRLINVIMKSFIFILFVVSSLNHFKSLTNQRTGYYS